MYLFVFLVGWVQICHSTPVEVRRRSEGTGPPAVCILGIKLNSSSVLIRISVANISVVDCSNEGIDNMKINNCIIDVLPQVDSELSASILWTLD